MAATRAVFPPEGRKYQAIKLAKLVAGLADDESLADNVRDAAEDERWEDVSSLLVGRVDVLRKASEKDVEPAFILLIAILADTNQLSADNKVVQSIATATAESEHAKGQAKLKILATLYNSLLPNSPFRFDVTVRLVEVAARHDELSVISSHIAAIDSLVQEWGMSLEQTRQLYVLLSDTFKEKPTGRREAYESAIKLISTYTEPPFAASVQERAIECVAMAVRAPEVFNFEEVHALPAVRAIQKSHPMCQLLQVFLDGDLAAYLKWSKDHSSELGQYKLSDDDNIRKMRILTLITVTGRHVPGKVDYKTIAKALEINESEVEVWVIDAIRLNLLDAKMDQLTKSVQVRRTTYREFKLQQWKALSLHLEIWRKNLGDVATVLQQAKQMTNV